MKFEDLFKSNHDENNLEMKKYLQKDILSDNAQLGEIASKALIKSLSDALNNVRTFYDKDEVFEVTTKL